MDLSFLFSGANIAMAGVTIVIVQLVKFFLPPASPASIGAPTDRWSVSDRWTWIPLYAAFVIGILLSIVFDPHVGQPPLGKVSDGLQTGAYAVAMWEIYSKTFQGIVDRLRGK